MVNNTIVSRYGGVTPKNEGDSREIPGGPLYPVSEVLELLKSRGDQAISSWTEKCIRDMQKWSLDASDQREIVELALKSGDFRGSEWCTQGEDGPWAACDAYVCHHRQLYSHSGGVRDDVL